MFRFSLFTVVLALFMALASIALPVAEPLPAVLQSPDRSTVQDVALDSREPHILAKRRSGKATFFNTGLGNCGKVSNDNQLIVALATKTYANGKFCGKTITIKNTKNGKTTTAKVMDSCPGCGESDLDLSPAAFKKIGALSTGVLSVTWNFN